MRKYFLLSAVALLTATNVNAGNYADLHVGVDVEYASTFSCAQALDFGTIVIDPERADAGGPWSIRLATDGSATIESGMGIVSIIGAKAAECSIDLTNATMELTQELVFVDPDDNRAGTFTLSDIVPNGTKLGATLNFTEVPGVGQYDGNIRLTIVN